MKFKVAILQMKSLNRQYQKSADIVIRMMKKASENGADILLLPEAFLTGYELPMSNEEALADQNPYLDKICTAAAALHIGAVITAITKGRKKPQNSAYVVDKSGKVLMKYSKVHTCDFPMKHALKAEIRFRCATFAESVLAL